MTIDKEKFIARFDLQLVHAELISILELTENIRKIYPT
jgi:hypothetical protein